MRDLTLVATETASTYLSRKCTDCRCLEFIWTTLCWKSIDFLLQRTYTTIRNDYGQWEGAELKDTVTDQVFFNQSIRFFSKNQDFGFRSGR